MLVAKCSILTANFISTWYCFLCRYFTTKKCLSYHRASFIGTKTIKSNSKHDNAIKDSQHYILCTIGYCSSIVIDKFERSTLWIQIWRKSYVHIVGHGTLSKKSWRVFVSLVIQVLRVVMDDAKFFGVYCLDMNCSKIPSRWSNDVLFNSFSIVTNIGKFSKICMHWLHHASHSTTYRTDCLPFLEDLQLLLVSGVSTYFLVCELAYLAQKGASQTLARLAYFCVPSHNLDLVASLYGGTLYDPCSLLWYMVPFTWFHHASSHNPHMWAPRIFLSDMREKMWGTHMSKFNAQTPLLLVSLLFHNRAIFLRSARYAFIYDAPSSIYYASSSMLQFYNQILKKKMRMNSLTLIRLHSVLSVVNTLNCRGVQCDAFWWNINLIWFAGVYIHQEERGGKKGGISPPGYKNCVVFVTVFYLYPGGDIPFCFPSLSCLFCTQVRTSPPFLPSWFLLMNITAVLCTIHISIHT